MWFALLQAARLLLWVDETPKFTCISVGKTTALANHCHDFVHTGRCCLLPQATSQSKQVMLPLACERCLHTCLAAAGARAWGARLLGRHAAAVWAVVYRASAHSAAALHAAPIHPRPHASRLHRCIPAAAAAEAAERHPAGHPPGAVCDCGVQVRALPRHICCFACRDALMSFVV